MRYTVTLLFLSNSIFRRHAELFLWMATEERAHFGRIMCHFISTLVKYIGRVALLVESHFTVFLKVDFGRGVWNSPSANPQVYEVATRILPPLFTQNLASRNDGTRSPLIHAV